MGASITEALMGAGEWNLDLRHNPELLPELVRYRHVVIYWGETPIFGGPLLWRTPTRAGIKIGGRASDWRLGQDGGGAVVTKRRYLSSAPKGSNPDFELLDAAGFPLYWQKGDDESRWIPDTAHAETGSYAMRVEAGRTDGKDDVLASTEPLDVEEGDPLVLTLDSERISGLVGRLRARLVFDGRFAPPNLFADDGFDTAWTNDSPFPGDVIVVDSDHVIIGPCTRPQVVTNPDFAEFFTGWIASGLGFSADVDEGYVPGTPVMTSIDTTGSTISLLNDADPSSPAVLNTHPVAVGEKWLYETVVKADEDADGHFDVRVFPNFGAPLSILDGDAASIGGQGWKYAQKEAEIKEEGGGLLVSINVWQQTNGRILFGFVRATRVAGNKAIFQGLKKTLTPERAYRITQPLTGSWPTSGPDRQGTILLSVLLEGDGRDPVILTSTELDVSRAETEMVLTMDLTPPSGYDEATVSIVAHDLFGGNVIARRPTFELQDTTKAIFDAVIAADVNPWNFTSLAVTTPAGSEKAHWEVVAEERGDGFVVDNVNCYRDVVSATVGDVLADVVVDDDTGLPLMELGEVFEADEELAYDLVFVRADNREILKHLSRSGVVEPREFRANFDNVLDSGLASDLYEDRTGAVLAYGDVELLDEPEIQQNSEERVTKVVLIGAELELANGERVVIVGEAELVDPDVVDLYGNPVHRILIIEDTSVDNAPYANALAAYYLEQSQAADEVTELKLADWRAAFWFNVGDTIYPYLPEAGLEDLSNEMLDRRGRAAWPKPVRALERVWTLGSGPFRAELWRPGEEPLDLTPWVLWDEKTSAEVHVGEVVPEFVIDPAGGAAVNQFTRFRARRSA